MKAVYSSEVNINFYQTTQNYRRYYTLWWRQRSQNIGFQLNIDTTGYQDFIAIMYTVRMQMITRISFSRCIHIFLSNSIPFTSVFPQLFLYSFHLELVLDILEAILSQQTKVTFTLRMRYGFIAITTILEKCSSQLFDFCGDNKEESMNIYTTLFQSN
jgi:hypothetical protein